MAFWKEKWGYRHSLVIVLSLVINGFLIELFSVDRGVQAPPFPYGIILLAVMLGLFLAISVVKSLESLKKWLISKPFIVTLITTISILIMVSGYVPQKVFPQFPILQKLGVFHITSSIPFVFLMVLLLASLTVAIFNRLYPFKWKNIAFLLNHIGILVVLIGGFYGSGDLKRVMVSLKKGNAVWKGHLSDKPSVTVELPFALKLNEFILEEYSPDVVIVGLNNKVIQKCGTLSPAFIGKLCEFRNFVVHIDQFIPNAFKVKEKFVAVNHIGTCPVVKARISDLSGKELSSGYVVQGSNLQNTEYLNLDSNFRLAIPLAKPKSFRSTGRFYTPENEVGDFTLEVNKPFSLKGWNLYQYGYDDKMGKWSSTSTVEAIRDPWLPVVYVGAWMMIIGALFLMFPSPKFLEQSDE